MLKLYFYYMVANIIEDYVAGFNPGMFYVEFSLKFQIPVLKLKKFSALL